MNLSRLPFKLAIKFSAFLLLFAQVSCMVKSDFKGIILASKGKIESLDPAQANKLLALQLISSLGDTLYRINLQGSLVPMLAKDRPIISKDGLSISIPLKENILFHDGTKFNAEAMAFSINRFIQIGTLTYITKNIKSIETPEEFLIRINLSKPSTSIKGLLTSINLTPISPTSYSLYKDKFLINNFIGTGPYKLINYSAERQSIEPFENYWGEKVKNSGITFVSFTNSTSLFSAIKTGQVDVLLSNAIEDVHSFALKNLSKKNTLIEGEGPPMEIGYIAFRTNSDLLKNKKIRKALLFSLDRDLISNQVSYGLRVPLRSLIPPFLAIRKNSPWPKYNVETASRIFKEAGFCNNKKLTLPLTFRSNVPSDKLLALKWQQQIKQDLSECLEISLNGVESTTIYKQLSEGAFEAVILDWTGDYPDPYAYLAPLLDCIKINDEVCEDGEAVTGGTFWANNTLQKSLMKSELLREEERLEELRKVERLAAEGAALLPIWHLKPRVWTRNNLSKPKFDGSGRLLLKEMIKDNE
jgi:peptide/nickel transport system substrate-binding protein